MYALHEPLRTKSKCRVELHVHLDGAIRPETIWEVMRSKNLELPGSRSLMALKKELQIKEPKNLDHFLKPFSIILPTFKGDLAAIERFAYEFVEDEAIQSIAYCEARFSPHLFLPDVQSEEDRQINGAISEADLPQKENSITVKSILQAAVNGLKRGEQDFGTKVRLILCCLRGKEAWSWEILSLCEEFQNNGVVGIDIAGHEGHSDESKNDNEIAVFESAKAKGIHRTVHAGEESGWESVKKDEADKSAGTAGLFETGTVPVKPENMAISELGAERIGHGYRVIENEDFYQKCLENRIHFEMCPHSSYLTGAISGLQLSSKRHPILRLAEDRASFSINSDDPTVTGTWVEDEYELLRRWGFTEAHFTRANFEAALNCFLPPDEKEELLSTLREAYGVVSALPTQQKTSPKGPSEKKPAISIASWEERTV